MRKATTRRDVERVTLGAGGATRRVRRDLLATEEPLEVRVLAPGSAGLRTAHPVAVTMRTPGADFELAAGFLYGESLIHTRRDVAAIRYCVDPATDGRQQFNIVHVELAAGTPFDAARLQRNFYMTSSCGVCGKASIEAVWPDVCVRVAGTVRIAPAVLVALPELLRGAQDVFDRTGGLHAAGLFTAGGELVRLREDVGRHNALDKLIGSALLAGELPLTEAVVLVSGRLSFELVQKAARAGVAVLAGVSAPSSLAVELAATTGMTLVGFVRGERFNIYAGGERIMAARETGERG